MGQLPSEQDQTRYQVENDPFVPPAETETYNEEDALQDLLDEMNTEEEAPEIVEFEENVEEDTVDIFNIQFDDEITTETESTPIVAPIIVATPDPEPEPEPEIEEVVEEDTIDIFNFQFDDEFITEPETTQTVAPVIVAAPDPEPEIEELDEEDELILQMDEDTEEITFDDTEELTDVTDFTEALEAGEEEFIEPTLDDQGFYIGPTTVIKGDHLLELEKGNYVVVGTFGNYRDAEEHSDQLFIKGLYTKFGYISQTKIYYVYIFESDDLQEAKDTSERFNQIRVKLRENWVLQVQ